MTRFMVGFTLGCIVGYLATLMGVAYEFRTGGPVGVASVR